jgi:hypothetical protein
MKLELKFSALQLATINSQTKIYPCACPMQVSLQIANLRKLYDYQQNCMAASDNNELQVQVHQRIADATTKAHQIMEQCLDEILELEGWNRNTLEMPAGIRFLVGNANDET